MKTLTFNKRHVLFGMMVLSLGLTKSWLQTADARGQMSASSEAGETSPSAPIRRPTPTQDSSASPGQSRNYELIFKNNIPGCDSKKVKVSPVTKTTAPEEVWNSEQKRFEKITGSEVQLFAKYTFECKSLGETITGEIALDESSETKRVSDLIEEQSAKIETDIKEQIVTLREEKQLADDIKNCVKFKDGENIVDLEDTKHLAKKYACLGRKVRDENSDRKERREAFQHQVVDEIQEALLNSESDAERRAILAAIKGMKSEIGFDSALAQDIKWLEKGANALASAKKNENLLALGRDSYLNPTNEYANDNAIDRIAWEFNIKTNPRLQKYSDTTKEMIGDWSDLIVPIAIQAQTKQDDLVREFYGEGAVKDGINNDIGGADRSNGNDNRVGSNPRNNNGSNQGTGNACPSRIVRCDTDITSLPLYQQNVGQQGNNYQGGMPSNRPTSTYGNRTNMNGQMNGIPSSYQQQRPPYQQGGMYQQPGMYQQGAPYQQGGMYQQRPPYQQGGMYQQPGMYQQRPPYQQGGMYNPQYPMGPYQNPQMQQPGRRG